jgi:c-di-GMP-binding flagellar brake protein YcgR
MLFATSPARTFLRSVADAFAENQEQAAIFEVLLVIAVIALIVLQMVMVYRRAQSLKLDAIAVAEQRGMTREEAEFAVQLANAGGAPAMEFLTHLDTFEEVTRQALGGQIKADPPSDVALPDVLRNLREALGFDRLQAHVPLLTTRELPEGLAVDVEAHHGRIAHVDESVFDIELREGSGPRVGSEVVVRFSRSRDARYELHCRVLQTLPGPAGSGSTLTLSHDEAPTRNQMRQFVRVTVARPATLQVVKWPGPAQGQREFAGILRDLSAGGTLMTTETPLPAGVIVKVNFQAAGDSFSLTAVNVTTRRNEHEIRCHLEFTAVSKGERDRLLAAVAKIQRAERRGEPPPEAPTPDAPPPEEAAS